MLTRRAFAALAGAAPVAALAQEFPRQSVRFIVPFAPGGATDIVARIVAPGMQEAFGGTAVVVENRGGAAGMLGAEAVLNAPPDGHTITLFTITNSVLNAGLVKNPRQDPRTAFTPVSLCVTMPMVLTVANHVPARSLPEFIAWLNSRDGRSSYGSSGTGSINHLGAHLFNMRTGTRSDHVPYRGAGMVYADMAAGNVDWLVEGIASQAPQVRAGTVRALAVLARTRNPQLPEVPTAIEQGLADFEIMNFMGIFAHAATPAPLVARLERAARSAVANSAIAQRLREAGTEPAGTTADEFRSFLQAQLALWLPVVEASGVRLE